MGRPRQPQPVKLFAGLLSADEDLLRRAQQLLAREFGPADVVSDILRFDQTNYYESEMGPDLRRCFVGFQRLIRPAELPDIKLLANKLEQQIAEDCLDPERPRPVNIDPGYLDLAKVVLASTKDASHRLYLEHGIYGEVTLVFRHHQWQTWPWTYADYQTEAYHAYFATLRQAYSEQRKHLEDLIERNEKRP